MNRSADRGGLDHEKTLGSKSFQMAIQRSVPPLRELPYSSTDPGLTSYAPGDRVMLTDSQGSVAAPVLGFELQEDGGSS